MSKTPNLTNGPVCPTPYSDGERVQLGHGSGGRQTATLIRERFLKHLGNDILDKQADAAAVTVDTGRIVVSTDTFVVNPIEFPGGNIGSLAVHGTVNDVAMMGATPRFLSAGFVLEEGLPFELLDRVVESMAREAGRVGESGIPIICADTKVVERGKADGLYINTTGIGELSPGFAPSPERATPGDRVILSAPIGRHGIAVLARREGLELDVEVESDSATLWPLVDRMREAVGDDVHVLRDPTRGGIASALNEIAASANVGITLTESAIPVPGPVLSTCELLGYDPLYVANEGVLIAIVAEDAAEATVESLRGHSLGIEAAIVGRAVESDPGIVVLETSVGGTRIVDMLAGDQLPRIC